MLDYTAVTRSGSVLWLRFEDDGPLDPHAVLEVIGGSGPNSPLHVEVVDHARPTWSARIALDVADVEYVRDGKP